MTRKKAAAVKEQQSSEQIALFSVGTTKVGEEKATVNKAVTEAKPVKEEKKAEPVKETAKKAEATKKAEPVKETAKKAEATKKAEPAKETEKKAEASKKVEPTKSTKKPAVKEEVKPEIYLQYAGQETKLNELLEQAKQAFVAEGHRVSSIKSIQLYVKPEESAVYYVINEKTQGKLELF